MHSLKSFVHGTHGSSKFTGLQWEWMKANGRFQHSNWSPVNHNRGGFRAQNLSECVQYMSTSVARLRNIALLNIAYITIIK